MNPKEKKRLKLFALVYIVTVVALALITIYYLQFTTSLRSQVLTLYASEKNLRSTLNTKISDLDRTKDQLDAMKQDDQYVRNNNLQKEIDSIQKTYKQSATAYEDLLKLREQTPKTGSFDKQYAHVLVELSKRNYDESSRLLDILQKGIASESAKLASSFAIPTNVATSNKAPGTGYSRQKVTSDVGEFLVDIIAADLNSTRIIADTTSDSTCGDNCPVMALADYASRSGAYAAINGPYFCPAEYPSCSGKTNSFDTLLMNKNKVYFNSDNNIYSSVPAVIFSGGSARFVRASSEWGRDTSPDSVIAGQPLLLFNGEIMFGGNDVAKQSSKGSRSFIGSAGSTVYIGIVHNASVAEVAHVLKTLGLANAINLDSGGSTAFISNGHYIAGPGRNLPIGILFVRK